MWGEREERIETERGGCKGRGWMGARQGERETKKGEIEPAQYGNQSRPVGI